MILPTHNHASTLAAAIESALAQSVEDFTLVVIGDGVNDDSRWIVDAYTRSDQRVVFIDEPKAPRHGEEIRDRVIRDVQARFIAYHGDDDLLFPKHLETMIESIGEADFVHPLPIFVRADETLQTIPTDLSRQDCIDWHLGPIHRNAVSLTGVLHTKAAYLRLPYGWRLTPVGRWTDHYMWQQFFELEGFRAVTASVSTTVKLTSDDRVEWGAEKRGEEAERWWARLREPGFQTRWNECVAETFYRHAVSESLERAKLEERVQELAAVLYASQADFERYREQSEAMYNEMRSQRDETQRLLSEALASRSWRATAWARRLSRHLPKLH